MLTMAAGTASSEATQDDTSNNANEITIDPPFVNNFRQDHVGSSLLRNDNDIMSLQPDPIEQAVQNVWLVSPGIGIQDLLLRVHERLGGIVGEYPNTSLKRRIRAAKVSLPYRQLESPAFDLEFGKHEFVSTKLQERQSLRAQKRFQEADRISAGLEAMGIVMDDHYKTWIVRDKPQQTASPEPDFSNTTTSSSSSFTSSVPCQMCGRFFASRNLMFKHLKDPISGCGNAIFASDQSIEKPPSMEKKLQRQLELSKKRKSAKTGVTVNHHDKACSLWIGDLPLVWTRHGGKYKRFRMVLRSLLPRNVPPPWIKTMVRKAYRSRQQCEQQQQVSNNNENDGPEEETSAAGFVGEYVGYAIVVFRDEEEALLVLKALDGRQVSVQNVFSPNELETNSDWANLIPTPPFCIKVRTVENNQTISSSDNTQTSSSLLLAACATMPTLEDATTLIAGQDPPLMDQLRPLSTDELRARTKRLVGESPPTNCENGQLENGSSNENGHASSSASINPVLSSTPSFNLTLALSNLTLAQQHEQALEQAVAAYQTAGLPRHYIHQKGRLVPLDIRQRLLSILQELRWSVPNHRQGMTAERYLVLQTKVNTDVFYGNLREACRALMNWADPNYFYSGIAVTKNFVASPHIDDCDQTYQYAISLGEFESGGELCVEGYRAESESETGQNFVNVVETRNRIARVDGRHVHWVRTFGKGDRYSLIFYDTSDRHVTPVIPLGLDDEYLARHAKEEEE
jgi:hypothetical protein